LGLFHRVEDKEQDKDEDFIDSQNLMTPGILSELAGRHGRGRR
jgi:hypothetical protein